MLKCEVTGCRMEAAGKLAPGIGRSYCAVHLATLRLKHDAVEHAPIVRDLLTIPLFGNDRSPTGCEDA